MLYDGHARGATTIETALFGDIAIIVTATRRQAATNTTRVDIGTLPLRIG